MGRNSFYSSEEFAAAQAEKIRNMWLEAVTEFIRRNASSYVLPLRDAARILSDEYSISWPDVQQEDAVDIHVDSIKDFLV